jgi:uncharacterized protein
VKLLHRRLGRVALAASVLLGVAVASAQSPQPLPKGVFPEAAAPSTPAGDPTNKPSTEPASLPRDNLGRIEVPPLARVTDLANALSPADRASLEAKLAAFESARGSQIAVVVVPSTQPEPIEDFANRIGNTWKIGRAGIGDGLLIVVATQDRRARIEVFRALEGAIPDVVARQIIRDQMAPHFKTGDFAGGISAALDVIFKRIEGEGLATPSGIPRDKVDAGTDVMGAVIPLVIIGILISSVLRRVLGVPGAALGGLGAGAIAGFVLSSVLIGAIAGFAVFLLSAGGFGRGGSGRVLGGRRSGGPIFIPGGWSGGGGWGGGGGGGGWSSGGGGDAAGGGASGDW